MVKRGGRLKRVSDDRRDQAWDWQQVKAAVDRRDRGCQANRHFPNHRCAGPEDPHHRWPVGEGGPRLDPANVVTLCRWGKPGGHDWVHANREAAEKVGLMLRGPA